MAYYHGYRECLETPLRPKALKSLPRNCRWVDVDGSFTKREILTLAAFLCDQRRVVLTLNGDFPRNHLGVLKDGDFDFR